jgi:hypothetical protein
LLKAPCKDCPNRHYLCHSECEKYIEYKKQNDEIREKRLKDNQTKNDIFCTYHCLKPKKRRRPYADSRGGY